MKSLASCAPAIADKSEKMPHFVPVRNEHQSQLSALNSDRRWWEGNADDLPHDYLVTAVIPLCDTPDEIELVVNLLSLQTVKPFIILIDTGSLASNFNRVDALAVEFDNVEVHRLQFKGVKHPSDLVSMAMDFAQGRVQTKWMFCTHADVFLKRRDVIEEFIQIAEREGSPAVGYQISPRSHEGWEGMISHTATLLDQEWCLDNGVTWNQWRCVRGRGFNDHSPNPNRTNMPDTEVNLNDVLRSKGITPHLVDIENPVEINRSRNEDHRIDHARSLTSAKIMKSSHYESAKNWSADAMEKAKERIQQWKQFDERIKIPLVVTGRASGLVYSPWKKSYPLMISGGGQNGTTAVMRMLSSALNDYRSFFHSGSRNAEDELMLALMGLNHESYSNETFDFQKVYSDRMNQFSHRWITKIPSATLRLKKMPEMAKFNWIVVTRDPLASTLSWAEQSNQHDQIEYQFQKRAKEMTKVQEIARELAKETGVMVVSYDSLLTRPADTLTQIGKWLDVDLNSKDLKSGVSEIIPCDSRYWGDI